MIPRLRRYGTVCLVIAFMLSGPAVAFSSSPDSVGVADEKMEAAAEKAFEEINKKMSEAQEAYYKPLTEAREKGLSDKEMEKIELDPELDPVMGWARRCSKPSTSMREQMQPSVLATKCWLWLAEVNLPAGWLKRSCRRSRLTT